MYHPAFGYFADDYGLEMIAIEINGKKATAKDLEKVVDLVKEKDIAFILYQEEFDSHQAKLIASEIDGVAVMVSPLDGDYLNNLKEIAEKLKETFK